MTKIMDKCEVRKNLTGPVASIATPFNKDGSIDVAGLRNYVDFVIAGGSRSLILTHGDSLFSLLSDDEIAAVTKTVIEHAAGRAMVCAATGIWPTEKTVDFARHCRDIGANLFMVLPPDWGQSCTKETLIEHYAAASKHMPVMVVTNIFTNRGLEFGLDVLKMLLERVPRIVALKDDFCNEFGRKMGLLVHEHWAVITGGQKQNHMNALPYGCDGYFSVFSCFKPQIAHQYWNAIQSQNLSQARNVIRDYDMPYFDFVRKLPGWTSAGTHGALELFGITKRWRRKPYYSLSDEEMEKLGDFFREKGLL